MAEPRPGASPFACLSSGVERGVEPNARAGPRSRLTGLSRGAIWGHFSRGGRCFTRDLPAAFLLLEGRRLADTGAGGWRWGWGTLLLGQVGAWISGKAETRAGVRGPLMMRVGELISQLLGELRVGSPSWALGRGWGKAPEAFPPVCVVGTARGGFSCSEEGFHTPTLYPPFPPLHPSHSAPSPVLAPAAGVGATERILLWQTQDYALIPPDFRGWETPSYLFGRGGSKGGPSQPLGGALSPSLGKVRGCEATLARQDPGRPKLQLRSVRRNPKCDDFEGKTQAGRLPQARDGFRLEAPSRLQLAQVGS